MRWVTCVCRKSWNRTRGSWELATTLTEDESEALDDLAAGATLRGRPVTRIDGKIGEVYGPGGERLIYVQWSDGRRQLMGWDEWAAMPDAPDPVPYPH
jgi:hypothetical protein